MLRNVNTHRVAICADSIAYSAQQRIQAGRLSIVTSHRRSWKDFFDICRPVKGYLILQTLFALHGFSLLRVVHCINSSVWDVCHWTPHMTFAPVLVASIAKLEVRQSTWQSYP
jgi:hypothetical protein